MEMQIKIFNIPIPDGEAMTEEMNAFLRANRILWMEHLLVYFTPTPKGEYVRNAL